MGDISDREFEKLNTTLVDFIETSVQRYVEFHNSLSIQGEDISAIKVNLQKIEFRLKDGDRRIDGLEKTVDENMINADKVIDTTTRQVYLDCAQKHAVAFRGEIDRLIALWKKKWNIFWFKIFKITAWIGGIIAIGVGFSQICKAFHWLGF
jgi:hypothetical protein